MLREKAPDRRWFIPDRISLGHVCLLAGDGGLGKSTLALQLAVAAATGTPWLGCDVARCKVLVLSGEDEITEMHWRIERYVDWLVERGSDREALLRGLSELHLLDATTDLDPALASFAQRKTLEVTPLLLALRRLIVEQDIGLVVLDSAADVFDEEINRSAVRGLIRVLRSLQCNVVLLSHPSVAGLKNGSGLSGSTHWSNSVRSRFVLERPVIEAGVTGDTDLRVLTMPKNNRGPVGQKLILRWTLAGFICEPSGDTAYQADPKAKFVELLREYERTGQSVSPNRSAKSKQCLRPVVFAKHPLARGVSKRQFETAMQLLLTENKIAVEEIGPASRRSKILITTEAANVLA